MMQRLYHKKNTVEKIIYHLLDHLLPQVTLSPENTIVNYFSNTLDGSKMHQTHPKLSLIMNQLTLFETNVKTDEVNSTKHLNLR